PSIAKQIRNHCQCLWSKVKCAHQQQVKAGKVSLEQTTISEALCRNLKDKQIIASVLTDKMSEEDVNIKGYHHIFNPQCFKNTLGETIVDLYTFQTHGSSKCSNDEWSEYVEMPQVRTNKTPSEWMKRIWPRLQYFRENNLLSNKRYFEARKEILLWNGIRRCYDSYAPEIGIAICFSCNKLIYVGQRTKNIGNYNYIGIEKHWATHCTGNSFCSRSWKKIKACTIIQRKFIEYYYCPDGLCASELAQHIKYCGQLEKKCDKVN
ncbi:44103_t:CDS:2, partial [Gigaspora margarita]